ncbi:P-II family nitrogen regulator [Guggenheimella bovis]
MKRLTLILNEEKVKGALKLLRPRSLHEILLILAKGTVEGHLLRALGIKNEKRVWIEAVIEDDTYLDDIYEKKRILEANGGIAFLQEIYDYSSYMDRKEGSVIQKITVIVERGKGEEVMRIAKENGARGGTILHGRGSTTDVTETIFGMDIEPERELVVILLERELAKKVAEKINEEITLHKEYQGILYIEDVLDAKGLR